ncbi:hypothetical protein L1987_85802 [Smallanthus sonchifolius]|uniref:Uncharacterized protein n=1 Tax=Smallanthus sonchifolius TaxID=185202 RepID=A0ACB8XXQ9_9ASTR|nr:hypothetical protein L1987_85802 [Smallanthus sonchifolius]
MSTARSHENSANNDTEETSEHSSSSRSTSLSRSLNIRLNAELPIAAHAACLRCRPIARRTWPQGMSPPRQPQPPQPQQPRFTNLYLKSYLPYHNVGMASSSDASTDESGYVTAKPPCPRAAYVTGPDPTRTIDLNVPDHPHEHVLGKCPMWLPAKSSGTKSDARSPSATHKDLKYNATSPRRENTVSTPMRLERPKARTRENARKRTHLTKKVTFEKLGIGEPSTKASQVVTPRESTKEYVQLYGYFD